MQLRPEFVDNIAFENVYSMSGMPDQNIGYVNANSDHHHHEADGSYLVGYDDKANSHKRMPEDEHDTSSNKRAKSIPNNDFTAGFQQGGSSQFSNGMEGNLFVSLEED